MPLRLLNARRLADDLAENQVSARDQALYLAASFVIAGLLTYLFIVPPPLSRDRSFYWGMWAYEFGGYVLIHIFGVLYCLRRCRVEPSRNFLIDFSCLYAPVSLTTFIAVWIAYYLFTRGVLGLISSMKFEDTPPNWIYLLYDARFLDVLRVFAILLAYFLVLWRIGELLLRISAKREG